MTNKRGRKYNQYEAESESYACIMVNIVQMRVPDANMCIYVSVQLEAAVEGS